MSEINNGASIPVAWRWKPKTSSIWIYDPDARWLDAHRNDTDIDLEPLYTAPQAPAVRVKGLADKLKLAEYVMTKDSFCEAERLEEGLSVVRRVRSALEAETDPATTPDERAVEALRAIVARSNNDPLGTSKVNDMRTIALVALATLDALAQGESRNG